MFSNFRKRYIGDKGFYMAVIALIIPMIVQQGITQFVNLLDNVMGVGNDEHSELG